MKFALACAAILALTATLAPTPALARHPSQWIEQSAGQEVFNLQDMPVGRIERYIDISGVPGAVEFEHGEPAALSSPAGRCRSVDRQIGETL